MSVPQEIEEFTDGDAYIQVNLEMLISFIHERPVIWDKTLEEYKDRNKNRKAWDEICSIVFDGFDEKSPSEKKDLCSQLMKKWKNVKDCWMRYERKEKALKKSGAGAITCKKYVYEKQLQFLKQSIHPANTISTIPGPDQVELSDLIIVNNDKAQESSQNNTCAAPPVQTRKNKRKQTNTDEFELKMMKLLESDENNDPHLNFMKSLLPNMKEFTNAQFLDFQVGVLSLIKNITSQNNPHVHQATTPLQTHNHQSYTSRPPLHTDFFATNYSQPHHHSYCKNVYTKSNYISGTKHNAPHSHTPSTTLIQSNEVNTDNPEEFEDIS